MNFIHKLSEVDYVESNVQVALVIISLLLILAIYFAVISGIGVGGEGLTGMRVLEYFWDV